MCFKLYLFNFPWRGFLLAHLVSSPQPLASEILAFPERVFRLFVMPSNENRSRYGKDKIGGLILKEKSHGHLRWHPSGCQSLSKNFRSIGCCLGTQSCPTLAIHGLESSRLLYAWDFPGKNTGQVCHFLLQGIFPAQGLNLSLQHLQADSLPRSTRKGPHQDREEESDTRGGRKKSLWVKKLGI